jgi:hypothetical protein
MKKYLPLIFSTFLITSSFAQTTKFEGIFNWNVIVDVIDSDAVNNYKKAILKEDNSEVEETIKELAQQLNDPEMQYLLLENPTIKSTMQKKLKELNEMQAVKMNAFNNAFFPTSLQMSFKNNNSFTKIEGGSISNLIGNILYLSNEQKTYFIKDETKTYSVIVDSAIINTSDKLVSLTQSTDTAVILDHTCIKYILVKKESDKIRTSYFWITTDLPALNSNSFRALGFATGNIHHEAYKKVNGIPLKVEYIENGFKFKMEVFEIIHRSLLDSYFVLPTEYKITNLGF